MVVVPKPSSLKNVFGLNDPQHMYTKLLTEIVDLQDAQSTWTQNEPYPKALFLAYNVAVTAWHMTDWVWMLDPPTRAKIGARFNFQFTETNSGLDKGLLKFQEAVVAACPALYACREVANASKHMRRKKSDPNIKAVVEYHPVVEASGHAKVGDLLMSLWVIDNGNRISANRFFIQIASYWEKLLKDEGLMTGNSLPPKIIDAQRGW